MRLTLAEAAMGCGAKLEAPASALGVGAFVAQGYSIDSRTIAPGELFFAVRGERLDGHDFIAGAMERGAVAAVVSVNRVGGLPDAVLATPLLIVEDPLQALQALAAHVRRHWGGRVVAITGSAGKTSTKGRRRRRPCGEVQYAQVAGQSEQSFRTALATAAFGARARIRGHRNGHESCR